MERGGREKKRFTLCEEESSKDSWSSEADLLTYTVAGKSHIIYLS